jgi:hypothetical protein
VVLVSLRGQVLVWPDLVGSMLVAIAERVVRTVRFRDSKGFPSLLLVEVEYVLMRVVGTAQFRDSKGFPVLLLAGVEKMPMRVENHGNKLA